MSTNQKRLDLQIDVFDKTSQWAKPLPTLKPTELVDAILQEFRELEYLSSSPTDYNLVQAGDEETLLQASEQLSQQIADKSHLKLLEVEKPLPKNAKRATDAIYLRELTTGKVYKLHWLPAIIGRPDKNQALNDWIAVDLESYKTGLRVSRRHAQITERDGRYFIESMSRNPTLVKDAEGNVAVVSGEKRPLEHDDVIQLERSNIALKFIIRSQENA